MKIVMHDRCGKVFVEERTAPECGPRQVLIRTAFGWISSGTEGSFLRARRAKPPDDPRSYHLGYTASGVVLKAGAEATGFEPGKPVALYGSPHVCHATEQAIGRNLVVPVPAGVPLWQASSVGLGAIALHGLRQIGVTLGDVIVQFGLGPLGMLAAQLAEAMGAEVLAVDLLPARVEVFNRLLPGRAFCADRVNLQSLVKERTRGRGADAVVMAISGAKAVEAQLAGLLRDRGRISLLGGSDEAFPDLRGAWLKELQVAYVRAGGPGRRDPSYEVEGNDYPIGYVPWTEGRNMEAYLRLLATGRVQVAPIVSHYFPLSEASQAWDLVIEQPGKTLGVVVGLEPGTEEVPKVKLNLG